MTNEQKLNLANNLINVLKLNILDIEKNFKTTPLSYMKLLIDNSINLVNEIVEMDNFFFGQEFFLKEQVINELSKLLDVMISFRNNSEDIYEINMLNNNIVSCVQKINETIRKK